MEEEKCWDIDEEGKEREFTKAEAFKQYEEKLPEICKGIKEAAKNQRPFLVAWVAGDDLTKTENYRAAPCCSPAECEALILALIAQFPNFVRYDIALRILQGTIQMHVGESVREEVAKAIVQLRSIQM